MAKVPYIPLYIGDWLQDMDSVSLEAEAAWLRIVFKMHKDGRSGVYKTNAKGLQRLWKCDANTLQNIIQELELENIGDITQENGLFVFKNRRMIKEQAISSKRKSAAQKRWKKPKDESKSDANHMQNPEYEYESEDDNEVNLKKGVENFEGITVHQNPELSSIILQESAWLMVVCRNSGKSLEELKEVFENEFVAKLETDGRMRIKIEEIRKWFANWLAKRKDVSAINWDEA